MCSLAARLTRRRPAVRRAGGGSGRGGSAAPAACSGSGTRSSTAAAAARSSPDRSPARPSPRAAAACRCACAPPLSRRPQLHAPTQRAVAACLSLRAAARVLVEAATALRTRRPICLSAKRRARASSAEAGCSLVVERPVEVAGVREAVQRRMRRCVTVAPGRRLGGRGAALRAAPFAAHGAASRLFETPRDDLPERRLLSLPPAIAAALLAEMLVYAEPAACCGAKGSRSRRPPEHAASRAGG
jgi:hypothetical protein